MEEGDIAPNFTLPSLRVQSSSAENSFVSLSDYRGKVVVLDFWSAWCLPCRNSVPGLALMRNTMPPEHFELVSVDIDAEPEDARLFLEGLVLAGLATTALLSHPVAMDPQATTAQLYQYSNIPTAYLINRQGIIERVHRNFSADQVGALKKDIRQLIEKAYEG